MTCEICNELFSTLEEMYIHYNIHEDNINHLLCKFCKKEFKDFKYRKKHEKMNHMYDIFPGKY